MTTKKTIKVRDLKPNKDAKGGAVINSGPSFNHGGLNTTTNTTKPNHGHHHNN